MLETVTSVMSCSLCDSHCSEEPLYLCGHIVCERCESGDECPACKFETNGNIPLSRKLIDVLYDDLIKISSGKTPGVKTTGSFKIGFDLTNKRNKESYLHDNILETVKRYRNKEIDLPEVIEEVKKPADQTNTNCSEPASVNCQPTYSSHVPFELPPQVLSDYEPPKRIYHSRRGGRRNASDRRRKRNVSMNSGETRYLSHSCSESSNDISDEDCDITNIISSHQSENGLPKKINKINVLSTLDDEDVLALAERYRGLSSDRLAEECCKKNDDSAFSEMPTLERQDIYEVDNTEFIEEERDMCNLEIEHDLHNTITTLNNSEKNITVDDTDQIAKVQSKIDELKCKIDEIKSEIDVVKCEIADNGSIKNTLASKHKHSSSPNDKEHFQEESKINQFDLQEKRPVNVTLQRTSENCYKVKSISSVHEPASNPVNAYNSDISQTHAGGTIKKIEEPSAASNSLIMSSSEGYKTTSDNSSLAENSRKSRCYPKKRKKKFPKLKGFDHLNCNGSGMTSFSHSRLNAQSTDGEHLSTSSDSDDSISTHSNLYSCFFNKKSVKKLKRNKFDKKSSDQRIRCLNEMNRLHFQGFKDDEILSLSVKVLFFNSVLNPASSLSFYFGEKEIIVRNRPSIRKKIGLATELKTPDCTPNLHVVSPVQTVERICSNATFYLDRSIIDTAGIVSSTPATVPSVRSRRQLLFDTPHIQNVLEFPEVEENPIEAYNVSCRRNVNLESYDDHSDIIGGTHTNAKRLTDSSTQTSPLTVQRGYTSTGSLCAQPRQWSFQNQLDELLDKTDFRVKEQDKNLCFAASGLSSSETVLLAKLARMTQSSLIRDFSHETTHLVVGESVKGSNEYLLAIAYRVYIVTIEWVILCLRENTVLSPMAFIAGNEEGPRRCLEPVHPPFEGFFIFLKISSAVSDYSSYELTKTLCSLGGAKLILDHEKFNPFVPDEAFPRFFIFEDKTQLTDLVIDTCKKLQVVPLSSEWVRASIAAFRAQPILDYLGVPTNRSQLSQEYYIPMELLLLPHSDKES